VRMARKGAEGETKKEYMLSAQQVSESAVQAKEETYMKEKSRVKSEICENHMREQSEQSSEKEQVTKS